MHDPSLVISVVVPTRDRVALLKACLRSLRGSLGEGDELIVVDSASRSTAVLGVTESYGALYLRCEEPGASRARNMGWRAAKHDLVAFVDDDVRVAPIWAKALVDAFAANPGAAFVTGRTEVPPEQGFVERAVAIKDDPGPAILDASTSGILGHSANLAVRKDVLEKVKGFDERLGPGSDFRNTEDLDLFDRIFAAGLTGRYEPLAHGWHEQLRSQRELVALDWTYGIGMGARVAKLLRTDRPRARYAAGVIYWSWGLQDVLRYLRARHLFLTLTSLVRTIGGIVGFLRCLPVPVRDGHFAPRHKTLL